MGATLLLGWSLTLAAGITTILMPQISFWSLADCISLGGLLSIATLIKLFRARYEDAEERRIEAEDAEKDIDPGRPAAAFATKVIDPIDHSEHIKLDARFDLQIGNVRSGPSTPKRPKNTKPSDGLRDRLEYLMSTRWSRIVASGVTHPYFHDVAELGSKLSILCGRIQTLIDFRARTGQTDKTFDAALETIVHRLEESLNAWGAVFELRQNTVEDDQALLTVLSDANSVIDLVERDTAQPHRDTLDLQKRMAVFEADLRKLSVLPQTAL